MPRRGSRVQISSPAPFRPPAPAGLATAVWSYQAEKRSPAKARYPSGKGEVCKTFMRRFDPGPRLQSPQQLSLTHRQGQKCRCGTLRGLLAFRPHFPPSLRHCGLLFLERRNLLRRVELLSCAIALAPAAPERSIGWAEIAHLCNEQERFRCARWVRPQAQIDSSTGTSVHPYFEIEYRTQGGTMFS